MTGPGEGKLLLKNAKVYLDNKEIPAEVYIHVKGYSLARVTHLDIEHEILNEIIKPEKGYFYSIYGVEGGIKVKFGNQKFLLILHPFLTEVLKNGEKTRTWVGGKFGGIYIGFRKEQIVKLEKIAREKFNFPI
jgi:hypothetical protein